jgi:hypothetical protein
MTTTMQPLATSIITAPLAAIDRRALSQAWYSALHVQARASKPESAARPVSPSGSGRRTDRIAGTDSHGAPPANGASSSALPARREAVPPAGGPERRAPRSPLARRIESAFLDPRGCLHRATFSVGDSAGSRVHVTLQSAGGRVRLVALCHPSARARVARALAQARYALGARGVVLEHARIGESAC